MALRPLNVRCCTARECLAGCGVVLYWFPRVAIPLAIVWGTISHIVYTRRVGNLAVELVLGSLGVISGVIAFIAYYQVWRQGPGSPLEFPEFRVGDEEQRSGLQNDDIVPDIMADAVESRYDGTVRFCKRCNVFKPDRTHHCRQCGMCVLRMDHHCPWFTICIGLRNHKYFIQFLWYVWVLCMCADIVATPSLYRFFRDQLYYEKKIEINLVFFTLIAALFVLIISVFGTYTTMLAVENRTTIESMEVVPYRTSLPASEWRYRHPPSRENLGNIYDMGWKANIEQLFGSTWKDWLLPIQSKLKYDGRVFPYNNDLRLAAEERAQTEIAMRERKRMFAASVASSSNAYPH